MTTDRFHTLAAGGHRVVLDTEIGHLRALELQHDGRTIAPLHVAPWTTDAPIDRAATLAPTEQALAGDFLCAPFCASDVEGGPIHGLTANEPWTLLAQSGSSALAEATYELSQPVMGATVTKRLQLRDGEPFLYVEHAFKGGEGKLPASHHAMIRVSETAALTYSPKALVFTPGNPPEPNPVNGRSLLKYPAQSADIGAVALAAGGTVDLSTYPVAKEHEEVLTLLEAPGSAVGWTVALREAEDDVVMLIKDSRVLPVTTLWMSNGGRYYAPWNGRHKGVLGIEDGRAFGTQGHAASIAPNALTERGVPTAFELGERVTIRYVIGAVGRPEGWTRVGDLRIEANMIVLTEAGGATLAIPCNAEWLEGQA